MKEMALSLVAATFGAAILSYLGNRKLFEFLGEGAAVTLVPWWEEGCKAIAVLLLPGAPALWIHLLFGGLEFLYDVTKSRGEGLILGLMSLGTHGLTGGAAAYLLGRQAGLWWVYAAVGAIHTIVSVLVVSVVLPALRSSNAADARNQ